MTISELIRVVLFFGIIIAVFGAVAVSIVRGKREQRQREIMNQIYGRRPARPRPAKRDNGLFPPMDINDPLNPLSLMSVSNPDSPLHDDL